MFGVNQFRRQQIVFAASCVSALLGFGSACAQGLSRDEVGHLCRNYASSNKPPQVMPKALQRYILLTSGIGIEDLMKAHGDDRALTAEDYEAVYRGFDASRGDGGGDGALPEAQPKHTNPFCFLAQDPMACETPPTDYKHLQDYCERLVSGPTPDPHQAEAEAYCRFEDRLEDLSSAISAMRVDNSGKAGLQLSPDALKIANKRGTNRALDLLFPPDSSDSYLICTPSPPGRGGPPVGSPSEREKSPLQWRLRGTIADLSKPGYSDIAGNTKTKDSKFEKYSAATIAYRDDREGEENTFAIKGAIGAALDLPFLERDFVAAGPDERAFYRYGNLIIGSFYERSKTNSDKDGSSNVHTAAPTLMLSATQIHPQRERRSTLGVTPDLIGVSMNLINQYTFDIENDAEKVGATLELEPLFRTKSIYRSTARRDNLSALGTGIFLSPEFKALVEVADIVDGGSNIAWQNASDYAGAGVEVGLALNTEEAPVVLDNFTIETTYRHLDFFGGDLPLRTIGRFQIGVNYAPPGPEYFIIKFQYVNGQNMNTFVDEEYFDVSLGVRY